MVSVTVYLVVVIISAIIYHFFFKKNKNTPPSPPFKLPIIGHALHIGRRPYLTFTKWNETYGKIISVQLGPNKAVIINDLKYIKEMFNDPVFSGRVQDEIFHVIPEGPYGVINSQEETWEAQRRYALRNLRDFGFGKSSIESLILEEANELIEIFRKEGGKPFNVTRRFSVAVLNSLWTIVTGSRNSQTDPKIQSLMDSFNKVGEELGGSGLFLFAPWVMKLAPEWSKYNSFLRIVKEFGDNIRETIKYHKKTLPDIGNPRDFVDAYLHEIKKTTDPKSSFYGEAGEKNLYALLGDLFQAGAETSSSTLSWAFLFLGGHQHVQEKLHEEIDRVIGKSNIPSLNDRTRMPYTDAVISEVLRRSTITAMGVFHTALADKEFQGFTIEKGSWLIANVWGIHFDKEIWGEDAESFRPERFLSPDETKVVKNEALIPFLTGKRQCLGESLARDTLFLFITYMFQTFKVKLHLPNGEKPNYEPTLALLLTPQKFRVILEDRL